MKLDTAKQIKLLARLGYEFAVTEDLAASLYNAVKEILNMVGAEAGSIFLLSPDQTSLICKAAVGPVDITGLSIPADQGVVGYCVQNKTFSTTDRDDPNFNTSVDSETGFTTTSIATTSILVGNECLGALQILNSTAPSGRFDSTDLELLSMLGTSAGMALQNAELTQNLVEQSRIKHEMKLARAIQNTILDLEPPLDANIAGANIPAREVSGDFYSVSEFIDGKTHFCIADVSSKGAHAGMLMARVATLWRVLCKQNMPAEQILLQINNEICETNYRGMFCTMVSGVKEKGQLHFAMAGHEPVLHYTNQSFTQYESGLPPLGIMHWTAPPEVHTVELTQGPVYMYTDGVTDGYTQKGSPLSLEGLKTMIQEIHHLPTEMQCTGITRSVSVMNEKLRDDVTLLVFGPP